MVELGVSPKAGIGSFRRILIQKIVRCLTPDHIPGIILDFQTLRSRNQATLCILQFTFITEVQQGIDLLIGFSGIRTCFLRFGAEYQCLCCKNVTCQQKDCRESQRQKFFS